ncbi:hypothetical protein Nepgr_019722 [Nepenthes gracilis]|uniref:Uncharacterized protein n=1 Tax=Nepenthes gracilis TaxID=150966 RepID=A0AAD3XVM0_NEPGR|nr:hypothetical protein Nepgr_019722 [Nepenthes gracilis]
MAISKLLIASFLISFLVFRHLAQADQSTGSSATPPANAPPANAPPPVGVGAPPAKIDCPGACGARCKLSKRPNLCQRACGSCCSRCNCVPPGTSGNYGVCPCYASLTTRGNRRKCP